MATPERIPKGRSWRALPPSPPVVTLVALPQRQATDPLPLPLGVVRSRRSNAHGPAGLQTAGVIVLLGLGISTKSDRFRDVAAASPGTVAPDAAVAPPEAALPACASQVMVRRRLPMSRLPTPLKHSLTRPLRLSASVASAQAPIAHAPA